MAFLVNVLAITFGLTRNATMFIQRLGMQTFDRMEFVTTRMMQHRCIALLNNVFLSIANGGTSIILMIVLQEMQNLISSTWTGINM